MLPHEIEPFADANIQKLDELREKLLQNELDERPLTPEELLEARNVLSNARNALVRFKVCMADEVQMKERFRIQARDCRLHHK